MKTNTSPTLKRFNYLMSETCAAYHAVAVKLGLSDSAMQILYTLYDLEGCCPLAEVCRLTGISKQTVNSALRNMERDGILRLEAVSGKAKAVILTEHGTLLAKSTVAKIIKAENEIFAAWSGDEIAQYLTLTERYLNALKEKTEDL